jgi:hypothetical protein
MNDYTNLLQNSTPSISGLEFISRIQQSPKEMEMLLVKTRERIINEIIRLNGDEFNSSPRFDKQMKLIIELYDYGFQHEAIKCFSVIQDAILETHVSLVPWMNLQLRHLDIQISKTHCTKLFIEDHYQSEGLVYVTWCYDGLQNLADTPWHNSAFTYAELVEFVEEEGLIKHSISDSVNHLGEHVQQEDRRDVYTYVQEELETIIQKYLQSAWPRTEL